MTYHDPRHALTQAELAHLGEGSLAYLRKIDSDELKGKFPSLQEIASGMEIWALFAANGQPLLLSDARDTAIAGALENHLTPLAIN
ncbi:DUF1150 family protein [Mesorhizobium sp. KR1-2]|uniref:BQ00720 family protein n=1 Tax=Mesorhizobium sp. KR1-2 TaxID=3156609 RepID=UPI0032B46FD9